MKPLHQTEFNPASGQRRWVGIGTVIGLHVLIGWALASGLARKAVQLIQQPITVAIVPEQIAPPPPPPPPPPPEPPKPTKLVDRPPPPPAPPPPAYVPPPDVPPPAAPAPVIQAVQPEPPKAPVVIKPVPPPAPPAPPAPAPAPPSPVQAEVGISCPGYKRVLQTALGGLYDRIGVTGVVKVQIHLRGDQITDVVVLSGPREYHRYVQSAVRRMTCSAGPADTVVPLEISFREE
jgi:protein TonB